MDRQILTFRELIAPLQPEAFFGEVYRRKPLHLPGPGERAANAATRKELATVFGRSLDDPQVGEGLEALLRRSAFERLATYSLPDRQAPRRFRVLWQGRRLEPDGAEIRLIDGNEAHPLDAAAGVLAEWALAKDYFAETWLAEDFSHLQPAARSAALANLHRLGLIEVL